MSDQWQPRYDPRAHEDRLNAGTPPQGYPPQQPPWPPQGQHPGQPPSGQWPPQPQRPPYEEFRTPQPGYPPQQPPGPVHHGIQRPPRRPASTGRKVALWVVGSLAALLVIGVIASAASSPKASPAAAGSPVTSAPASHAPSASAHPKASAAAAKASKPKATTAAAPSGPTVTYVVTGSTADVTYGPAGSDSQGSVPMHVSAAIPSAAPAYYAISAQLQGSGSVSCEILVNGNVVSHATANGSYNIAQCEIVQDPLTGGWDDANS